ncbi:Uu.00g120450.m01.CDS01 [Anthostomella pinea]|uniref:Uu.00g120450.m01.CDS01 n=1 Tax=Anthostomella pinea TaxID=933095 RepID=A0AAI8YH85_9PEZI|nr:Uu.00g120450.m01.CDS01 [Anthostomella pinea]
MKGIAGVRRPVYQSLCHDPCDLQDVDEDTIGHHNLVYCAAFNLAIHCTECSHHWQEHMHIRYSQSEEVVQATDQDVQQKIDASQSDIHLRESGINSLETQIKEIEAELGQVREAACQFGLFLKNHSITPYNDAMIAYLDEMIKEERQVVQHAHTRKLAVPENEQRLANLEESKRAYQERINILETHMKADNNVRLLDEQGVDDLVNKLYNLKYWGKTLQGMRAMLDWSKTNGHREHQHRPKPNGVWQAMASFASKLMPRFRKRTADEANGSAANPPPRQSRRLNPSMN